MDELEAIRGHIDALTARSWAQEAMLLMLMSKESDRTYFLSLDVSKFVEAMHDQLRSSDLTDRQILLFQAETKALIERLRLIGGEAALNSLF